jgi:molecular chaperone HtpG
MTDRIDEWLMGHLTEFDGKQFQDVARGQLDLGKLDSKKEKNKQKNVEEEYASLVERVSKLLNSRVKEVRVSHRLTDSAACLAVDDNDMGLQMRKIMEASGQSVPETKPILELNPQHPLVIRLDKEQDEERFGDIAAVLFGQASLAEGGQLSDPADFTSKLNKLLLQIH